MHLIRLAADGFRNLQDVRIDAHPRLNAFLGENGEGKTNLLESIHLAAALRPLRQVERTRDLVNFGLEQGVVRAEFEMEGPLDVEVLLQPGGRRATLAGKPVRDIAEVASRLGVVAFTPEDLAIVRGAPERRRQALDRFAFGLWPSFAAHARRFEQALERRNRVLKDPRLDATLLASYTETFIGCAVELARARARAAEVWAPAFAAAARQITDERVASSLRYRAAWWEGSGMHEAEGQQVADALSAALARSAEGERQRRTTLAGPHLDDVVISLGDRRARHLASQGEARAIVLALKLATVRQLAEARGTGPLVLLDDVAGELDPKKAQCLFRVVDDVSAQAFVTATHRALLPVQGALRCFALRQGRIESVCDVAS